MRTAVSVASSIPSFRVVVYIRRSGFFALPIFEDSIGCNDASFSMLNQEHTAAKTTDKQIDGKA